MTDAPSAAGDASAAPSQRRARTRAALIAAAAEVMAAKGLDRASLDEICARAGLTRGAFHGNFASREALIEAVMEAETAPVEADLVPGAPLAAQLAVLGRAVFARARDRLPRAALSAAFQAWLLARPERRDAAASRTEHGWAAMAAGLERLLGPGVLPMPAARLVRVIDALSAGLTHAYFQAPDLWTEADFVAAFQALAGPPAPPAPQPGVIPLGGAFTRRW